MNNFPSNPSTGRWLSRDSKYFADGSNLYAYGRNSPIDFTDPFGTIACSGMLLNAVMQGIADGTLSGKGESILSDGTTVFPNGTVFFTDGTIVYPDGTIKYASTENGQATALGWWDDDGVYHDQQEQFDQENLQRLLDDSEFDAEMRASLAKYNPSSPYVNPEWAAIAEAMSQYSDSLKLGANIGAVTAYVATAGIAIEVGIVALTDASAYALTESAIAGGITTIPEDGVFLAVIQNGEIIAQASPAASHAGMVASQLGSLPAGAEVVTVGKHAGEIFVLKSATYYGTTLPASATAYKVIMALFQ